MPELPPEQVKLLPCPFCDSVPALDERSGLIYIRCEKCAAGGNIDVSVLTHPKTYAIRLWNTRSNAGKEQHAWSCEQCGNVNSQQYCVKCGRAAGILFYPDAAIRSDLVDAKVLADAIEVVKSVIQGWRSDIDESWDERPDLSFEASDKIAGANEILQALETLGK